MKLSLLASLPVFLFGLTHSSLALYQDSRLSQKSALAQSSKTDEVKGHYIVQLKPGLGYSMRLDHEAQIQRLATQKGRQGIIRSFDMGNFQAYHCELDAAGVEQLRRNKNVCPLVSCTA